MAKTALYKYGSLIGYFDNSKEIFQYIKEAENKNITCLCSLKNLGYQIKKTEDIK